MSRHLCQNDPDNFCYVCGSVTFEKESRVISESFISLYFEYSKRDVSDQDKKHVPHLFCASCYETLRLWSTGDRKSMPFGTPMIWGRPSVGLQDCYFCNHHIEDFNRRNRHLIKYPGKRVLKNHYPMDLIHQYHQLLGGTRRIAQKTVTLELRVLITSNQKSTHICLGALSSSIKNL
ncbi:hypothetical protein QAD02_005102 [Eretmocerus hayati]|uniref:Uncharacterized protein n=1 Tax=Eretmocerus hayati TaxID=131215 RepID=A0ACC2NRD2_9HYME|nr:hypothetical protein QAD02_005102 [Eretmocerus hayati]